MVKKSLILLAALPLAGCFNVFGGEDPGPMSEMSEVITDFEELSVGGAYDVVVQTGKEASLTMEGPENMLAATEIVQENGKLTIKNKSGSWNWRGNEGVNILIGVPSIRAASVGGGSDVSIDSVEGETFSGSASGGGDLKVAALNVTNASFAVSGGADIEVAGAVTQLDVESSGGSDFIGKNLVAENATLSSSGGSDIDANVTGTVTANSSGGSDINITGGADCTKSESGGSSINCE